MGVRVETVAHIKFIIVSRHRFRDGKDIASDLGIFFRKVYLCRI